MSQPDHHGIPGFLAWAFGLVAGWQAALTLDEINKLAGTFSYMCVGVAAILNLWWAWKKRRRQPRGKGQALPNSTDNRELS